ncbi:hypothetical protein GP486_007769 [Trichoglossum hirsutum]|uniref:Uncharacterized protein n=1 Tax=Trichoglossum hirsutum TaxID=265104 RepID=A0A9P8IEX5_9PEZI|nr:hypothetical protein GP486_007769 [Trichoglossum hirsutum]
MPPSLVRQDALVGDELRQYFIQPLRTTWVVSDPPDMDLLDDPFCVPPKSPGHAAQDGLAMKHMLMLTEAAHKARKERELSSFEKLVSTHPPVFESLLVHLPTRALFNLYHTSSYLQNFLQSYPTAWSHLSFRLPQSSLLSATPGGGSTGNESPNGDRQSKAYALDQLLMTLVLPFGTRLKSLDLDNTLVSGLSLTSTVLPYRKDTLEHLSVRGCKNVSLKYHLVPYLQLHLKVSTRGKGRGDYADVLGGGGAPASTLALKSLYTYRCRHHRRRPYLPVSLVRRDSDSEPTHELVNICHKLGIWTDTAWCPTPGGRCLRRRDYHTGRGGSGTGEVWVVFDRLWRSGNRIGPTAESQSQEEGQPRRVDGRMWEDAEYGDDGEALGHGGGLCLGEGKQLPTHLRKSHKIFIDNIFCDGCGDKILERCEQCSVRMHCMGCRRSFCASCAFDRRLPKHLKKPGDTSATYTANEPALESIVSHLVPGTVFLQPKQTRTSTARERFWWAPGATRSPNLMRELSGDSESDSEVDDAGTGPTSNRTPPKLNLKWCCLEPMFSGGGGIAFVGPGMNGQGADKIRTAPLPRGFGWEDDDFRTATDTDDEDYGYYAKPKYPDLLPYLKQENIDVQASTSPRSLCQDCYNSRKWKVECKACKVPLCKEHDLRGLKTRVCGYRELIAERERIRGQPQPEADEDTAPDTADSDVTPEETSDEVLQSLLGLFWTSDDAIRLLEDAAATELPDSSDDDLDESPDTWPSVFPTESGVERGKSTIPTIMTTFSFPPSFPPRRAQTKAERDSWMTQIAARWLDDDLRFEQCWFALGEEESVVRARKEKMEEWVGCGAYFCQASYRPMGDSRGRCTAAMRVCSTCGVHQCKDCVQKYQACDCSYCRVKKNCPNCYRKLEPGTCKKVAEDEERRAKAKKDEQKRKAKEKEKLLAGQVAEMVGEFFCSIEEEGAVGEGTVAGDMAQAGGDS